MTDEALTTMGSDVRAADTEPPQAGMRSGQPVRRSPAHRRHTALGARWATEGGWQIPAGYGVGASEKLALEGSVGVADITARAKVDLRGDVPGFLRRLSVTAAPGHTAGFASGPASGLLAAVSDRWAVALGTPESRETLITELESAAPSSVMVTDAGSLSAGFALAGPRAFELLARATGLDPSVLPPGSCAATRALEVTALLVHRDLPATVVEFYVGSEFGRYAWDSLFEAGGGLGVEPVGWDALRAEGWW